MKKNWTTVIHHQLTKIRLVIIKGKKIERKKDWIKQETKEKRKTRVSHLFDSRFLLFSFHFLFLYLIIFQKNKTKNEKEKETKKKIAPKKRLCLLSKQRQKLRALFFVESNRRSVT